MINLELTWRVTEQRSRINVDTGESLIMLMFPACCVYNRSTIRRCTWREMNSWESWLQHQCKITGQYSMV